MSCMLPMIHYIFPSCSLMDKKAGIPNCVTLCQPVYVQGLGIAMTVSCMTLCGTVLPFKLRLLTEWLYCMCICCPIFCMNVRNATVFLFLNTCDYRPGDAESLCSASGSASDTNDATSGLHTTTPRELLIHD